MMLNRMCASLPAFRLGLGGCALLLLLDGVSFAAGSGDGPVDHESLPPSAMILIPAGKFIMGSTAQEREYALRLDEARGSLAARKYKWFDNEQRRSIYLDDYLIDEFPVTNRDYQRFVTAQGAPPPYIGERQWAAYGLVHPYDTVRRFLWRKGRFPQGRGDHPVVLVDYEDAQAYCHWRGGMEQRPLRLPSEAEWEKAARGDDGRIFPWGDEFDPRRLNSLDKGPYDTLPVGRFPLGASPYGVQDMAGMVFEWTASVCPGDTTKALVKGGSWDDYPGVTRPAARHCRPRSLRHILIGFRCVADRAPVARP